MTSWGISKTDFVSTAAYPNSNMIITCSKPLKSLELRDLWTVLHALHQVCSQGIPILLHEALGSVLHWPCNSWHGCHGTRTAFSCDAYIWWHSSDRNDNATDNSTESFAALHVFRINTSHDLEKNHDDILSHSPNIWKDHINIHLHQQLGSCEMVHHKVVLSEFHHLKVAMAPVCALHLGTPALGAATSGDALLTAHITIGKPRRKMGKPWENHRKMKAYPLVTQQKLWNISLFLLGILIIHTIKGQFQ